MHLTWGGPAFERGRGVSRGRSSEDSRRKAEGAKGRRTPRVRSTNRLGAGGKQNPETDGRGNCGSHPDRQEGVTVGGLSR
jgi:hypothetical protein